MKRFLTISVCTIIPSLCLLANSARAQTSDETSSRGPHVYSDTGPLPTPAQLLTQRHIPLTKDSLVAALRSDQADVRSLAAQQLAAEDAKEAIPSIYEALETEQMPFVRLNLAAQLAHLGDKRGIRALQADCDDSRLLIMQRLQATDYLLDLQEASCPQTFLLGLQDAEAGVRVQAVSMAPRFKKLSPGESAQVLSLLVKSLWDSNPFVRISASDALRTLGVRSAIPVLKLAIARETGSEVRAAMQQALKALEDTRP